jgi:hypothetical protein
MKKLHAGSGIPHGHLNKGTEPKPAQIHVGSGRPLGVVHGAPQPPVYGTHGGTDLPRRLNKRGK